MTVIEESRPFAQQLSNVYFTILSLFCFKLFVKISLAILSHFYIVKGNRKEAARIAAEFYGVPQGQEHGKLLEKMHQVFALLGIPAALLVFIVVLCILG